jgi:hypothetical protein
MICECNNCSECEKAYNNYLTELANHCTSVQPDKNFRQMMLDKYGQHIENRAQKAKNKLLKNETNPTTMC